jgi:hypothetical protein
MIEFTMWYEAVIFFCVFGAVVLIPCVCCGWLGVKMINRLGRFPTKTPVISLSIFIPLVLIELATFLTIIGFYNVFAE